MDVEIAAEAQVPEGQLQEVRRLAESLDGYVARSPVAVRLALRPGGSSTNAYVADAHMPFEGRVLAAHAAGGTAVQAADAAVQRLRRQLRRVVDADVALRNDPRTVRADLAARPSDERLGPDTRVKPPEERRIVHRRTYADGPEPTLTAVADLLDDDEHFHLFVHARTEEDVVVFWRDDGRIGLLFPPGSVLADEDDVVVPLPSRYADPLPLEAARSEMDLLDHRFLYFIDAADGRGKVLYLRFDGDYGLVEPA